MVIFVYKRFQKVLMRKGLLWVKKVVVMLICMVMVTDSQAVGAIAAKTADTLMAMIKN